MRLTDDDVRDFYGELGLTPDIVREDIRGVLALNRWEVPSLRNAIAGGRIDGTMYDGRCGCLFGSIAKAKGVHYKEVPGFTSRKFFIDDHEMSTSEEFFYNIEEGDTPETSAFSRQALAWVDEFIAETLPRFEVTATGDRFECHAHVHHQSDGVLIFTLDTSFKRPTGSYETIEGGMAFHFEGGGTVRCVNFPPDFQAIVEETKWGLRVAAFTVKP